MPEKTFAGSLKPGVKLGKYEVREQLATGGMAIIYKAYDPSLDRYVAIKQIAPHLAQDERFLERFRTEAQTLARLSSSQANIVNVHELIQQDGQLYLVMECVEGTTLRVLMDRGPVPLQTGLGVLLSTALGLKAMHAQGIVHRDLTPPNIMMAKDGALKITDFGLIGHSGGKTSLPMGTTKYMAPEMFSGVPVDARADLYSLGMIAYEMFIGPDKFAETFRDVLRDERAQQVRWMHWHSNPALKAPVLKELQPGIPPLVSKIVERMMEKDPSKRFASSEQIIRWLRRIFVMHVQGRSISVKDSETLEKEMETESSTAVPAVRQPAGAATQTASRAGAVAAESGERTAPLPQPKWTWKRAAFWAAVIGGPLIAISAGLLVWKSMRTADRKREATQVQLVADQQFSSKDYAAAAQTYAKMALEFTDLPSVATLASQRSWMARAEDALAKKDWETADAAATRAERTFNDPTWVTDFRQRSIKAQDIEQFMKQVDLAVGKGDYQVAIDLLTNLQTKYGNLELNPQISEYREKRDMREYTQYIDEGKAHYSREALDAARQAWEKAKAIRETTEVVELLKKLENAKAIGQLTALAQQAEANGKWGDAADYWKQILAIEASETIRTKMSSALAEALALQATAFDASGLTKEAEAVWAQVIQLNPNHAKAVDALKRADRKQQLDGHLKLADQAMAAGEWDKAVNSYTQALALLDDTQAALKTQIEEKIVDASHQKSLGLAKEALDRKDFTEAERLATEAQGFKDTDEARAFLLKVDTTRQYQKHLDVGKALLAQFSYSRALAAFQAAQKVMDTQEVRDLITETNYSRFLAQAKTYLADKRYREAIPLLKIVLGYKKTPLAEGLLKLAQEALRKQEEAGK